MAKSKLNRTTPSPVSPSTSPGVEDRSDGTPKLRPFLPMLLMLFIGSGCAALIYEVVWLQLLQLVIGSSAVSMGALLGTYMGGMCLGSLLLARVVSKREHPLRIYAFLELGIGLLGILVLFGVPLIDHLYAAVAVHGFTGVFLRAVISAICLLPPTLLMGASLPAMARWVEASPEGVSWLGFFYGGNIAGAVFGCLLAGFYLLRVFDMATATFIAAGINVVVALIGFQLAKRAPYTPSPDDAPGESAARPLGAWQVYATIGLSGMTALGAEVIWTRLLSLMYGATVYTFSIILAVFLAGLGLGSSVGSILSRRSVRPRIALGCCQLLLAAAIAWTAYSIADSLPYWPINPLLSTSAWFNFQVDLMRTIWAIFPAACLWGASFPLALAAVASAGQDSGRLVGETYAANTVGAILGAIGFSVILIPAIGTQDSQRVLIALAALASLLILLPFGERNEEGAKGPGKAGWIAAVAAPILIVALVVSVDKVPWLMVGYGRRMATTTSPGKALYMGEGMNSSIVISQLDSGQIYFHVSGKVEASTEPYDMRLQLMLGHIPALIDRDPESVLVVGFGAGVTAGTFVLHPEVKRIAICEIEPLIPPAATRYFKRENHDVYDDPRTQVYYDDARHFILTTPEKFDIITSDPIHPWVKGTSTLYSREYFELVKQHLKPGGVVTQWVPLYESDLETVKTELATFFDVFPNGTVWSNDINGEGYDIVLLGQAEPTRINVDELQQRLMRPDQFQVVQSLREVNFSSALGVLATYAGRASDLAPWLKDAQINQDLNLRLQYLAGMGLNFNNATYIYNQILEYRRFPSDIFTGSQQSIDALRAVIAR